MPKLLIVDDEPGYRRSLKKLLELDGFEVETAEDAGQAIEVLSDHEVDVVVTDIIMPGLSGLELLAKIKEVAPRSPVVLITGEPTVDTAIKAVQLGAVDYITKPFSRQILQKAVRNALRIKTLEDLNRRYLDHLEELVKERTATIRDQAERLRLLHENVSDAIWTLDLELHPTFISPSIAKITGFPVDEAISRGLQAALTPQAFLRALQVLAEEMEKEGKLGVDPDRRVTLEFELVHKNGSIVESESTIAFIRDQHGKAREIIGVTRDVTQRKRAEREKAELERRANQARRLEAIGAFAGGIAHDFNNLLAVIIGNAQLLLEAGHCPDPESQRDLELIHDSALRARDLVNQILLFSREGKIEKQPIHLGATVKNAAKMLRSILPSNIEVTWRVPNPACPVMANPTQIQQILLNLAGNSAHAMAETGGAIRIALDEVIRDPISLSGEPSPLSACCRLAVSDNGPGIDPAIIDRVIEPFFTTKRPNEGSGLGLSVVHGIVLNHHGELEIESPPGKGVTVNIYLPLLDPDHELNDPQRLEDLPRGNETILIVDDDPAVNATIQKILARLGYHVTALADPNQALNLVRQYPHRFQLIVTDLVMPDLPGDLLARELAKINPHLPIIIHSGGARAPSPAQLDALENVAYLQKPITIPEFAAALRAALSPAPPPPGGSEKIK